MDALTTASLYTFDANVMSITRHATASAPKRTVYVPAQTRGFLATIRSSIVLHVNACNGVESGIDAWQDVLAVYFAHWEE